MKREKIKRGARKKSSVKPTIHLTKGDWLDVLDGDGVWNVARVLSVPAPDKAKITYDGWPEDYDEVVCVDSHRVAPYHTFTWTVKCWVKYLNWPLWPSVVTLRAPGTAAGINNLAIENRLFVDFLDNPSFAKRDRCWQKKAHVRPFEANYDMKRAGSTGESFERALGWVLQSDAVSTMPKFAVGTLPIEYKHSPAKSVETVRRDMDDELWFRNFNHSKMRHQMNHVYETIEYEKDKRSNKGSMPPTLRENLLDLSGMEVEPRLLSNAKKRPLGIKVDQSPRIGKEMPQPMDSSDDSDIDDAQNTGRLKKKHTKRKSGGLSNTRKAEQAKLRHSVSPCVNKTSKSLAQLAGKDTKANRSKGQARRRVSPNGKHVSLEVVEAQNGPIAAQMDIVAAAKRTKRTRLNNLNVNSDQKDELEASIMLSMRSKAAKKKGITMGLGQHLAAGKASRVGLNGRSISSTRSQGTSQPISPCVNEMELHRPRSKNSDVSRRAGEVQDVDKHSTCDDGCSQELRRRFCVMQADQEDADATETVKCSKKTVISVPRKCEKISASQIPTCYSSSMVSFAPPPGLRTLASSVQTGAALAALSATVFSSSNGFSMESWFKRKLMTDFMGGET